MNKLLAHNLCNMHKLYILLGLYRKQIQIYCFGCVSNCVSISLHASVHAAVIVLLSEYPRTV